MSFLPREIYIPSAVLSGLSLTLCAILCCAIILSPKSRSKGFNIYLVFLLLPDVLLNLYGFVTFIIELSDDKYLVMISYKACVVHGCIFIYYTFANMWTSALICYEVHQLLVNSHNAVRFQASKPLTVIKRATIINISAVLCSVMMFIVLPEFGINSGLSYCWALFTRETRIVLYFFVVGLSTAIPLLYLLYITFDVYWRKLLPPTGKSRFVATFFLRTTTMCAILTIMIILALVMETDSAANVLIITVSGQGLVVGGLSILKPDVQKTVWRMLTCQKAEQNDERPTIYSGNGSVTGSVTGSMRGGWKSNSFTGSIFKKSVIFKRGGTSTQPVILSSIVEGKSDVPTDQQ